MGNVKDFTFTLSINPKTKEVISETLSVTQSYDGIIMSANEEEQLMKEVFVLRRSMYDRFDQWAGVKRNEEQTPVSKNQLRTLQSYRNLQKTKHLVDGVDLEKLTYDEAQKIIQEGINILRVPDVLK